MNCIRTQSINSNKMANKALNVYYASVPNMGDILNKMVIEDLFGFKVRHHTYLTGELSAIGSGLGQFTLHGNYAFQLVQKICGLLFPSVTIWGTGFICYKDHDTPFYRKNIKFSAVRGQLSKSRVERIIGQELDIPVGDAGILSSYLMKTPIVKKYKVGIISHFKEQDNPVWEKLLKNYEGSTYIDVRQHPSLVIPQIAECEYIISSSLHGLIIADSFNIPNIHIVVTDNLLGDGFKFDDYYSAYGVKHTYLDLKKDNFPTLDWIDSNYKLTIDMVEKIKNGLIQSFPFKNEFAPIRSLI